MGRTFFFSFPEEELAEDDEAIGFDSLKNTDTNDDGLLLLRIVVEFDAVLFDFDELL